MKLLDGVTATATVSDDGIYRYALTRQWGDDNSPFGPSHVLWIMLNPSTADADEDDPTIRRCQDFARRWGHDGITVVNLFALRSTLPALLRSHPEPVGPENDAHLERLFATHSGPAFAAWGTDGKLRNRDASVLLLASRARRPVHCLGTTKQGHPKHPLYVPGDTTPVSYRDYHRVDAGPDLVVARAHTAETDLNEGAQ